MNDLHEDLDRALRTVTLSEAPVEGAKRDGRRLRARRRATLLAGALAVAAVAAGYPALTQTPAAPPGSATAGTPTPSVARDPAVTAFPAPHATQAPGGLTSTDGEIGAGAIGKVQWQVTIESPGTANAEYCFTFTSDTAGITGPDCGQVPDLAGSAPGVPAVLDSLGGGTAPTAVLGVSTADVAYYIVTFTDGQQLKLIPVTAGGHRYFAWAAPASMAIASVDAHLGGPYNTSGQVASTVPFNQPGQLPDFALWHGPGLPAAPPRAAAVLHGTNSSGSWKITVYQGPWGTCAVGVPGGAYCMPYGRVTTTEIAGIWGGGQAGGGLGFAAPGTAKVSLTMSDGTTATARPVRLGDDLVFAFSLDKNVLPASWTTYDASGKQTGTAALPPAGGGAGKPRADVTSASP